MTADLRGPIDRCEIAALHDDQPREKRPGAQYLMYPMPCEVSTCEGRLVCIGHAVCSDCAGAIRAGRTEWTATQHDVDLLLLHGAAR